VIAYYLVHEGAHLLYALQIGVFKRVHLLGLGVQLDVYQDKMTQLQMGIFCLVGSIATAVAACILFALAGRIGKSSSRLLKACMYYITLAMLFIDPLYLSVLCGFFGGGDMNGISLLVPELAARIIYGILLVFHTVIFLKCILPEYRSAFHVDAGNDEKT